MTTTDSTTRRHRTRTAIIVGSLLVAVAGSIALLTSGPTEQATTKGVTANLHLPGSPDFAAFTPDGLWVAIHGSGAKQSRHRDRPANGATERIDPQSRTGRKPPDR